MHDLRNQLSGTKKSELDTLGTTQPGIHSEFPLRMGYWSWNLKPKLPTRENPPEKIKFFFTPERISLLSDCPCRGKIGVDRHNPDAFVGYLYPESSESAERAKQWVARFDK